MQKGKVHGYLKFSNFSKKGGFDFFHKKGGVGKKGRGITFFHTN